MKNFMKVTAVVIAMTACVANANAQSVETTESGRTVYGRAVYGEKARKAYLARHQADTIKHHAKNIGVGGKGDVQVVFDQAYRDERGDIVVSQDTVTLYRLAKGEVMNDSVALGVCQGNVYAVNDSHCTLNKQTRHRLQANILGGVAYPRQSGLTWTVSAGLEFQACTWLVGADFSLREKLYGTHSMASGQSYLAPAVNVKAGYKLWQNGRFKNYLALMGAVGLEFQRTDKAVGGEKAYSANCGPRGEIFLRYSLDLEKTGRFVFLLEGGYEISTHMDHHAELESSQTKQSKTNHGPVVRAGFGVNF